MRPWWQRLGIVSGQGALVIAILLLTVLALERWEARWDLSPDGRFTIQPGLAGILAEQDEPVEIMAVWSPSGSPRVDQLQQFLQEQLGHLAATQEGISFRHIDPVLQLPEWEQLQEEHGLQAPRSLYLLRQDRRPFRIPFGGALRYTWQRSLGGGLVALRRDQTTPLYLLQGHGELAIAGATADDSCRLLIERLRFAAYETVAVDEATLAQDGWGRLPDDGLVLVLGPTRPLGERSCRLLRDYLRAGGRLLACIDDRCPADLLGVFKDFGLLRSDAGIIQAQQHIAYGPDRAQHRLILDQAFGILPHSITARLLEERASVLSPRSVRLRYPAQLRPEQRRALTEQGVHAPDLQHSADLLAVPLGPTWEAPASDRAPPDIDQESLGRPLVLASDLRYPPLPGTATGPRILCWGSRDGAADSSLQRTAFANELFLLDLLADLGDQAAAVPIDPQPLASYELTVEPTTLRWLMAVLVAILPSSMIGIAILVWWERR